jgi:hypothetical protein
MNYDLQTVILQRYLGTDPLYFAASYFPASAILLLLPYEIASAIGIGVIFSIYAQACLCSLRMSYKVLAFTLLCLPALATPFLSVVLTPVAFLLVFLFIPGLLFRKIWLIVRAASLFDSFLIILYVDFLSLYLAARFR